MTDHLWTALVSRPALLVYFYMGLRVSQGRGKYNIEAPATTGHPEFEKAFRVHANTLEWLPLFLVSLWLFSLVVGDFWAAGVGAVWIIGRILYLAGYSKAPGSAAEVSASRPWRLARSSSARSVGSFPAGFRAAVKERPLKSHCGVVRCGDLRRVTPSSLRGTLAGLSSYRGGAREDER